MGVTGLLLAVSIYNRLMTQLIDTLKMPQILSFCGAFYVLECSQAWLLLSMGRPTAESLHSQPSMMELVGPIHAQLMVPRSSFLIGDELCMTYHSQFMLTVDEEWTSIAPAPSVYTMCSPRWLVYNDKVHTGGIFFRASTMVTDLALLLLGSNLELQGKGNFSVLGGRYLFTAEPEVTSMIADLQKELQELLEKKVSHSLFCVGYCLTHTLLFAHKVPLLNPSTYQAFLVQVQNPKLDLDTEGGTIVAAVMTLLSNEGEPNKPRLQPEENADEASGMDNPDMVVGMD